MSTDGEVLRRINTGGFGVLAFRGPDTAKFLQGQLSADTEKLAPGMSTLAGLHNPQGRVIALLGLTRTSPDEFFAVLPDELVATVAQRLRKFVLRARVKIEAPAPGLRVLGSADDGAAPSLPRIAWAGRTLLLVPESHELFDAPAGDSARWESWQVSQGVPQVYAATSETFVAQMLNLDLLGAIAFDKGCYTGQEVIARAHYRGRVKRRLQRWRRAGAMSLKPGDAVRSADGRALTVVRVASGGESGGELLAVGTFGAIADGGGAEGADAGVPIVEGPLPLPYELPE